MKTYIEREHTWKGDIYGDETHTKRRYMERGHIRKGDTHGGETIIERS